MGLESATYINELNASNPLGNDAKNKGDEHIRLIKSALQNTFPNLTGAVTATHAELSFVDGVTSPIQTQLNTKAPSASPTFTGTVTVPDRSDADNSTAAANTKYVDNALSDALADAAVLPPLSGVAGRRQDLETNGVVKYWTQKTQGTDRTITVGSGGDYSSLQAAIDEMTYKRKGYNALGDPNIIISLLSGYSLNADDQIILDGIDLHWVKITSVDATVSCDATTFSEFEGAHPVFGMRNGAKSPQIGIMVDFGSTASVTYKGCLAIASGAGSVANILSIGGCNRGYLGVKAVSAGQIYMQGASLTNTLYQVIDAGANTLVQAGGATLTGCDNHCIQAYGMAQVFAQGADLTSHSISATYVYATHLAKIVVSGDSGGTAAYDYRVQNGGMIMGNGTATTLPATRNTLTSDGVIFG